MHLFLAALATLTPINPSILGRARLLYPLVPPRTGCGAGCHYKNEALSMPENANNGWRKIRVKRSQYIWNYKTQKFENRTFLSTLSKERLLKLGRSEDDVGVPNTIRNVYVHCKDKKLTFSDREIARNILGRERNTKDTHDENDIPIIGSSQGSPFYWYQGLCQKEAQAYKIDTPMQRYLYYLEKNTGRKDLYDKDSEEVIAY